MPNPAGATAPILIGVLYDFPQADGGASFEEAVRLGLAEVEAGGRLDRPVELVARQAHGLPAGTAHDVEKMFGELVDAGVLAVLGPAISDNALIVTPLADRAGLPSVNYTGGEHTRSAWMFHYQVGSLEEEPSVLVGHIVGQGLGSVAVAHDHSPVGRRYSEFLAEACAAAGVDVTSVAAVSPLAEDLGAAARRLRASDPDALVYLGLGVAARALSLAVEGEDWKVPVVANSALMFGYARKDWRAGWEDWVYVDTVADDNAVRARLRQRSPRTAAGPVGVAGYDMGRLVGEALSRTAHLTRAGVRDALERVKQIPAASGEDGTTMGFGNFDHGALKGRYLVLRRWHAGQTVQVGEAGSG